MRFPVPQGSRIAVRQSPFVSLFATLGAQSGRQPGERQRQQIQECEVQSCLLRQFRREGGTHHLRPLASQCPGVPQLPIPNLHLTNPSPFSRSSSCSIPSASAVSGLSPGGDRSLVLTVAPASQCQLSAFPALPSLSSLCSFVAINAALSSFPSGSFPPKTSKWLRSLFPRS